MNPTSELYSAIQAAFDHFNKTLFDNQLPQVIFTTQRKNNMMGYFAADRWASKDGDKTCHEISINPQYIARVSVIELLQTLVHEMVHCWQHCLGSPHAKGYHNKEWAQKMQEIGLMPSDTGQTGGACTGKHMSDYPLAEGAFIKECQHLIKEKQFTMTWVDTRLNPKIVSPEQNHQKLTQIKEVLHENSMDEQMAEELTQSVSNLFDDKMVQDALADIAVRKRKLKVKYSCPNFDCQLNVWGKSELHIKCGTCGQDLVES